MGIMDWSRTIWWTVLAVLFLVIAPNSIFAGENNVYLGWGFGEISDFSHPEGNDLGTPECIGANLDCMFDNTNMVAELNTSLIGVGYRRQKIEENYEDSDTGEYSEVSVTNRFYTINLFPYTTEKGLDWIVIWGKGETTIDFKVFRNTIGGSSIPQVTPSRITGLFMERSGRPDSGGIYSPYVLFRLGIIVVDSDPLLMENGFVFDASGSALMLEFGFGF